MNKTHLLGLSSSLLFISACKVSQTEGTSELSSYDSARDSAKVYDIDPNDPFLIYSEAEIIEMFSNVSCNSFGSDSGSSSQIDYTRGLRGVVSTGYAGFESNLNPWRHLDRYSEPDAVRIDGELFFDKLNVPTRAFSLGFPLLSGELIKGPTGADLVEYFRVDFDGFIEPDAGQITEASYEFAVLADDGVRLTINGQQLIDHPTVTPTKLMCGTQSVFMAPEESMSFNLNYFQAPRFHIALVLLWRKVGTGPAETMCNTAGNSTWFNSNVVPSQPTANYQGLLNRGWRVVEQQNFRVPSGVDLNPCSSSYVRSVFGQ